MPKVVDHGLRRREVSEAVCRVVARRGVEAATVREIAEEAGYSTGVLSHYFENKDAMIAYAAYDYFERTIEHLEELRREISGLEALKTILRELLPRDEKGRDWWRVWLAFWERAAHDESLAAEQRKWYAAWRGIVKSLIEDGRADEELGAGLDAEREADGIVALVDGLGVQAVFEPERLTPEVQNALIDGHLSRLKG
ncbi:MAG: TetR/AcrR family transcriptional regulator [Rubrobacteraceae bacterium]